MDDEQLHDMSFYVLVEKDGLTMIFGFIGKLKMQSAFFLVGIMVSLRMENPLKVSSLNIVFMLYT